MYSLLLVDDEEEILQGIHAMIMASSLPLKEIRTASNARDALAMFESTPFDIIITDIHMPEMDGLEMIASTRAIWPETRVIFLTGYREFEYARKALQLGSSDYLVKPVTDEQLLQTLQTIILDLDRKWQNLWNSNNQQNENTHATQRLRDQYCHTLLIGASDANLSEQSYQLAEMGIPLIAGNPVSLVAIRADKHRSYDDETIHFLAGNILTELLTPFSGCFYFRYDSILGTAVLSEPAISSRASEEYIVRMRKYLQELQSFFYASIEIQLSIEFIFHVPWEAMPLAFNQLRALQGESPNRFNGWDYNAPLLKEQKSEALLDDIARCLIGNNKEAFREVLVTCMHLWSDKPGELERMAVHLHKVASHAGISSWKTNSPSAQLSYDSVSLAQEALNLYDQIHGGYKAESGSFVVDSVRTYIDSHYDAAQTLSSLSERFRINPSYLSRIFHKHVGEQLSTYITNVRIAEAKRLLRDTDLRVYEISEKLGFDNPNYFAKVFGRQTGTSPKEFRMKKCCDCETG